MAMPAAEVTACCSAMPTSKRRSGNRSPKGNSPVESGIAAANAWSIKTHGKEFDRLSVAERDAALKAMDDGKVQFEHFSAKAFADRVISIVMEGFFSDPMYGGNRDKAGWKMLGFPGLPATYADKVDQYYNKQYVAPPRSIADFS